MTVDSDETLVPQYDEKETKKILRKIDWHLLPVLAILYLLAFIGTSSTRRSTASTNVQKIVATSEMPKLQA